MQVNMQKLTLPIVAAVMITVAGVALTPGSAAANHAVQFSDKDGDGVSDAMDMCPDTSIPEQAVPRRVLLGGRYALTDDDTTFNTRRGRESSYTLAETRGCSCEQIIKMSGLTLSHRRFGCSRDVMRVFTATMNALPTVQEVASALEEQLCHSEEPTEQPIEQPSETPVLY